MTFLNSMGEIKKKKHSKKKSGSSKKRKVIEEECEKNGELEDICEITEEGSNDSDEEKVKGVVNSTIKEEASGESGDSDDDEEGDEDSNESNDSDDDDDSQDSEDSDEDDEDEEDSDDDDDVINDKKLYNILNSFFVDENEVSIATSMSNISYELNKLNKNLSKLLKSKE